MPTTSPLCMCANHAIRHQRMMPGVAGKKINPCECSAPTIRRVWLGWEEQLMQTKLQALRYIAAVGIAAMIGNGPARLAAQQPTPDPAVRIGAQDLGGVVSGAHGPEAGVWVIAETTGLPTPFAKIVVTD